MRVPAAAAKPSGARVLILLIVLGAVLLCSPVRAADSVEELADALGVDELEELAEETELSRFGSLLEGYDVEGYIGSLFANAVRFAVSPEVLRDIALTLATVVLLSALRTTVPFAGELDAVTLAGATAVLLLMSGTHESLTSLAETTILKLQDTANALLPTLGSAALLSGQITAAAAKYTAAAIFLNLLVNLCCTFVLPLVRLYLAAAAAEAAAGSGVLSGVLGFLKWTGATALSCLMLAFTLYLSLTSMASNSMDAAVVRSAKTAVAAMLPVVGSIAGDAASSILSAAAIIRQAVGSFGLLAVSSVLLAPFMQTGLRYLLLKGAAAVSSGLAEGRMSRLLGRLSEGMALLMGCIGSCGLLLFFSVYSLLRAAAV